MYTPHELSQSQERIFDVFAARIKAARNIADLFPDMYPPPERPSSVREPRRPFPTEDLGHMALSVPKLAQTINIMTLVMR